MRKVFFYSILVLIIVSFSACQSSSGLYSYNKPAYSSSDGNNSSDLFASNNKSIEDNKSIKKVIFHAFMDLKVKNIDTVNAKIVEIAKKYNGYTQEVGTYQTVIRVKSDNLTDAVNEIELLGKVTRKNISGQDVTDSYLDYQIRLDNAEKARKRYLELLTKAENVEAALKVEKELERLNETIDLIKGKMNRINHLSDYSTITVNIDEKKKPGIIGYVGLGLYYSVKWLFVRN